MKLNSVLLKLTVLASWIGLAFIAYDTLYVNRTLSYPLALSNFLSYFTIESNILVAVFSTYLLLVKNKFRNWENLLQIGSLVNISITGVVYALILAGIWEPKGLTAVANALIHYVTPIMYVLTWFIALEKRKMNFRIALYWMIFPLTYFAYSMLRGPLVDFYPYPFIDPREISYTQIGINAVLLTIAFSIVGLAFVWVNNRMSKR